MISIKALVSVSASGFEAADGAAARVRALTEARLTSRKIPMTSPIERALDLRPQR